MNEEVKRPSKDSWGEEDPKVSQSSINQGKTPVVLQMPSQNEVSDPSLLMKIPKKQVEDEIIDMGFIKELPKTQITSDGGVIKYLVSEGKYSDPDERVDSTCLARIRLELRLENGKILTSQQERKQVRRLKLFEKNSHRGLIPAVLSMKPGEIAWFTFTSDYYSANNEGITTDTVLYFRIEFIDFDIDAKNLEADDWEARVKAAKERGSALMQKGEYKKAQIVMNRSAEFIRSYPKKLEAGLAPQQQALVASYRVALNNNFALCLMKNGDHKRALDFLAAVLKKDEKNIKALYRRGVCYRELKDLEAAEKEFYRVLTINPQEEESKKQILEIQNLRNTNKKIEVKALKNIFNSDRWNREIEKEQEEKLMKEKLERKLKKEKEAQKAKQESGSNDGIDGLVDDAEKIKVTPDQLEKGFTFTAS